MAFLFQSCSLTLYDIISTDNIKSNHKLRWLRTYGGTEKIQIFSSVTILSSDYIAFPSIKIQWLNDMNSQSKIGEGGMGKATMTFSGKNTSPKHETHTLRNLNNWSIKYEVNIVRYLNKIEGKSWLK